MEAEDEDLKGRSWPFRIAWVATILWAVFFLFLLVNSKRCTGTDANPLYDLLANHFACLTANEVGDTVAGFFAPIAFFFVAAAVYIQAQELHAQKVEIRRSTKAQVEQARTGSEQLAALLDDKAARSRETADAEIFSVVENIPPELGALSRTSLIILPDDGSELARNLAKRAQGATPDARIRSFTNAIEEQVRLLRESSNKIHVSSELLLLVARLKEALDRRPEMTTAGQNRLRSMRAFRLLNALEELVSIYVASIPKS